MSAINLIRGGTTVLPHKGIIILEPRTLWEEPSDLTLIDADVTSTAGKGPGTSGLIEHA